MLILEEDNNSANSSMKMMMPKTASKVSLHQSKMSKKSVMILSNVFVNQPKAELEKKKALHFSKMSLANIPAIRIKRNPALPESIMNTSFYSIEPWNNE